MHPSLLKRITALEHSRAPAERIVVWRSFVRPGEHGPIHLQPVGARNGAGWSVTRLAGEGVDAFRARAAGLAPVNPCGAIVLHEVCEEEANA